MADTFIGKEGRVIKTGNWTKKTKTFYDKLKKNLKEKFGLDLNNHITSGDRTKKEDLDVGGKGDGRHTKGEAFDIEVHPVIKQYLWSTKEGLALVEEADFGLYDGVHGTGDHMHFGADISKNVIKPKARRKELLREGADGESEELYLTTEEIIQSNPNFIDPEFVKNQITQEKITPEQSKALKENDTLKAKQSTWLKAKEDYQKAQATGLKKDIEKTKKEYDDSAYELYKSNTNLLINAQKARRDVLKKEIGDFQEGTLQYETRSQELDGLINSLDGVEKKQNWEQHLIPKKDFIEARETAQRLTQPNKTGGGSGAWGANNDKTKLGTQGFQNKNKKKLGTQAWPRKNKPVVRVGDASLAASYNNLQSQLPKLLGEIDFETPEARAELVDRIAANKVKQEAVQPKIQAIADKEQQTLENNINKQNLSNEEKLRQKEEASINNNPIDTAGNANKLDQEAEDYFSRFNEPQELITPQTFNYDAKNYKRDIPFEAVGFGALALSGMSDARTKTPMRDEKVSTAILQYTADLKRLSEQGLKPEEEAKMKDRLAGAYSAGVNQLVRASGGNRNVVLGNLHTLNNARMRGITDIGIADIAIKQQNFEKYGQAIKEIQAFRTNRDIANHQIKLDDARSKQQGGAALASSGFASMLEEIQYQKENGPGSANHRMNKAFEIMLTGIDSDLEDPMDGSVPNTPSWQDANIRKGADAYQDNKNKYNSAMDLKDEWYGLSAEEKNSTGGFQNFLKTKNNTQASEPVTPFKTDNGILPVQGFSPKQDGRGGLMDMTLQDYYQD